MMLRTHLAITGLAILLFLSHVSNLFIFIPVALLATLLPDIDTGFSTIGKMKSARLVQFFVKHRGIFHSFTFCIAVSFLLATFLPVISISFFLGYSLHLLADSFTLEGIKPFWPLKQVSSWKIKTGGLIETNMFVFFLLLDIIIFIFVAKSVF